MEGLDLPKNILSAWIAIEALIPLSFKNPEDLCENNKNLIVNITDNGLIHFNNYNQPKYNDKNYHCELFYHIVIGKIKLDVVNKLLLARYRENYTDKITNKEYAPIAIITTDSKGHLVERNPVDISCFAWAYPQALNGNIKTLDDWEEKSNDLNLKFANHLSTSVTENNGLLDYNRLKTATDKLIKRLAIDDDHLDKSFFAIKKYIYIKQDKQDKQDKKESKKNKDKDKDKDKELVPAPESPLLNSFFLNDLNKAKKLFVHGQANELLKYYLGIQKPTQYFDLLKDKNILNRILLPNNMPCSRWPVSNKQSLVLLQQAAVNVRKFSQNTKILAVNGPPGTGKTTLLKDVIADIITERAICLSEFKDPKEAFIFSTKTEFNNIWFNFYKLSLKVTGYEILIASSNNNAVENISKDLPSRSFVNNDLNYFNVISEKLADIYNQNKDNTQHDTWGIISAALGNSNNRSNFKKIFWDDNDIGLRNYLKACSGQNITINVFDPASGKTIIKVPKIILECRPPSNQIQAIEEWRLLCQELKNSISNLKNELNKLEQYEQVLNNIQALEEKQHKELSYLSEINNNIILLELKLITAKQSLIDNNKLLKEINTKLMQHWSIEPGFIESLFNRKKSKWWKVIENKLYESHISIQSNDKELLINLSKITTEIEQLKHEDQLVNHKISDLAKTIIEQQEIIQQLAPDTIIVNDNFWNKNYSEIQQSYVWINEQIQLERTKIFVLAIKIHKSFIDNNATPIRHNLGMLMNLFNNGSLDDKNREFITTNLWQTLFLVVPVISSTFASIDRMFKNISNDTIGWLIIDEAGQATPQSAVGAMMRSKNAIIVGDPLQIEPIVNLPSKLTKTICNEFNIQAHLWNAPVASVQTCADSASAYGTELDRDDIKFKIGVPLLVHRRCDNPMFQLSNQLAYNGLMVHGIKAERFSKIKLALGVSCWYNVIHITSSSKWSEQEGQQAMSLLQATVNQCGKDPDIYIISPFREVAYSMRQYLLRHRELSNELFNNSNEWVTNRVGTIHTFQGKEAEAVIIILGAQGNSNVGARNWAGSKINILNVAITRAKNVLYVIGNFNDWHQCGYFNYLATNIMINHNYCYH